MDAVQSASEESKQVVVIQSASEESKRNCESIEKRKEVGK